MIDREQIRRWEQHHVMVVGLAAASLLALSASVHGGPRPEAGVIPQGAEKMQLIGVSRIDELPPLPPGVRPGTEGQLTGIPVPMYRMVSDEELALGSKVANTGAATAVVYRNSHDTGYGNFNKATEGNFVGNLLHLGNGFPVTGGEIKGYDTLIYHAASSPGGNASCIVSLWDGDPLGFIDTRISDPPQPIPGTTCTFTDMVQAGTDGSWCDLTQPHPDGDPGTCVGGFADGWGCFDDRYCGICPAIGQDDIAECPGLYRLECNFVEKVMLPSRNVWMIIEWTEGCRMGWRWAMFDPPEVAAVGEENFCAGTCPSSSQPCVDLAIEQVDAASQWDGEGVGTCCEDPGITCDHSDGVYECGHYASCSDGVAETFDAWCFGTGVYWASFVASIYANTETAFSLVPVGGDGNEINVFPGTQVEVQIMLQGWDPDGDGDPRLMLWEAEIDHTSYTTGLSGELTPYTPPCLVDANCPFRDSGSTCVVGAYGATEQPCTGGVCSCTAGFQDESSPPYPNALFGIYAVDTTNPPYYRWGAMSMGYGMIDPGVPVYGGTLVLDVPEDAEGTFTVGLNLQCCTRFRDQDNEPMPLLGVIPAKINVAMPGFGPPQPEPNAIVKNRFLSFIPGGVCVRTAQRVTFESLPPPNDVLNGVTLWVGQPFQLSDVSGSTTDSPSPTFTAAYLQCEPYYTDWTGLGPVHVYHRGVVPGATYSVQAIQEGDPVDDEGCYSSSLTVTTNQWGDVVGECSVPSCTPPNGIVDFNDIMALVDKFKNTPGAISKPRGDLGDELVDRKVGFIDIAWTIHVFQGGDYPFYVPDVGDCP